MSQHSYKIYRQLLHKARKALFAVVILAMVFPAGIEPLPAFAASSWSPTLVANTEAFQVIDDTDTTADLRLTFGTTLNKSLLYERTLTRFKFDDDLYIQGDLSVNGTMSGRTLRVYGAMSGNSLFVARAFSGAGLADCDVGASSKLLWDSTTGRFSCGTDQTGGGGSAPEVGTLSFTGGVMRIGDARWVKKSGDTMTGTLIIQPTITNSTALKLVGSGSYTTLAASGGSIIHTARGNPSLIGTYNTSDIATDITVAGRYAYVSDGTSGLHIIDISNPASPSFVSTYNTSDYAYDVTVAGRYAYVADNSAGLHVIDISNPTSPSLVGTYNTSDAAYGVTVAGRYAYVADNGAGLHVIDISNPASPTLVGTYDTSGFAYGITVVGRYAYVADGGDGLQIIDISNPASPSLVGTYATISYAYGVTVAGRYAYIANGNAGLRIIDISNPASPTLVSTYDTNGFVEDVTVAGRYAYIVDNNAGLHVIDISNPASPILVGTYDTSGTAFGVTVAGRYAYVADGNSGLQVTDLNGLDTPTATIGAIETFNLSVRESAHINSNLTVDRALNVGDGMYVYGQTAMRAFSGSALTLSTQDKVGKPALIIRGATSGSVIHAEQTLSSSGQLIVEGNLTFGDAITDAITVNAASWSFANNTAFTINGGAGTLEVVGGLSGSSLTVSNLRNCDTIDTNANGVLACGTDGGGAGAPEVGTLSFTGGVIRIGDMHYVKKQGDTMTGTLVIQPTIANTTALIIRGATSGSVIHAEQTLTSSGELVVEGRSTHNGVTVFNEDSTSTSHVRMESDNQVNMFFLDATNDRIGVGTATPKSFFDVVGNISGATLNVEGTATFNGNLVFGSAATDAITANASVWSFPNNTAFVMNGGLGSLEIVGTLSGSALTASTLRNCNTIDTNANGVLSCGTDEGGAGGSNEVGTTAFTGGVIRIADTRYVSKQGGTMTGGLNIDITSSDLVKTSSGRTAVTDFLYDAGASILNLVSENDYLTIAEGAISNAGQGTLTTPSSIVTTAAVGAGGFTILRDDGKYVIVHGNGLATGSLWDGIGLTMSATATNPTSTTVGAGGMAVRRPDGRYLVINGGAAATSALFDPRGVTATAAGPALTSCTATTGTNAFQIGSGTYVIMCGGSANWGTYNPTNNTYVAGTALGASFGAGAHAIQRDDGTFLVFAGGNTTTHYVYNPFSNQWILNPIASSAPTITTGAFSIRRADGRFLVIGGAVNTSTIYDPTPTSSNQGGGSFTSQSGVGYGPTVALGDGAGAVWRQDGKYFLVIGAGSTATNIIDPSNRGGGQFIAGPSLNAAPGAGSHMIIRPDGKAQIIRGGASTTTDVYDFNYVIGGPSTSTGAVYTTECMVAPALSSGSLLDFTVNSEDKISFEVRTGNGSCSGTYKPILNSGDRINPLSGHNRVQVRVTFKRTIPKFADQEWGLRRGLSQVRYRRVNRDPTLYDVSISNTTGLHRTQFDFGSSPDPSGPVTVNIANNTNKNLQIALALQNSMGSTFNATQQGMNNGAFTSHAPLPTAAGIGTIVMKRPDGTFVILAGNAATPTSIIYDPSSETFTANTVNPTKRVGTGALAFKRPDGKFLIVMGAGIKDTNIYDPVANTFTAGPVMTQPVGEGSLPIPLPNGRVLVLHGGFLKTSTIYDPLSNTTSSGVTAAMTMGRGSLGIPRPDGTWLVIPGASNATCTPRTNTALFNPYNMQFIPNTAAVVVTGTGPGAHAFQRSDGQWVIIKGGATAINCTAITTTNIYNADTNRMLAGPAAVAPRFGGFSMQRPDGSYAIIQGNSVTTTSIYYEKSGAFTAESSGAPIGTIVAGPTLVSSTGTGTIGFQRDDGKYVLFSGSNTPASVGTTTVQLFDPGWVASGYYRSENTYVPDMDTTSTLSWRAIPTNNGISAEVRTATGSLELQTQHARDVSTPGGLINSSANDKWLQVSFNLKRTFPSYGGIWTDVWYNGGTANNVTFRKIDTPTITEYSVGKDENLVDLKADKLSVFRVSTNGDIYSGTKGSVQTGGADLAERYTSPDQLEAGEVVSIDYSSNHGVKRATYSYQPDVLGVVSTAPGFVAGAFTKGSYPIALVGRVPVKVSTENGPIFMGDRVTSSSIPGAGTKAVKAGRTVGIAMENLDMNKLQPCGIDKKIECGTVMMFVNLSDWPGPGK